MPVRVLIVDDHGVVRQGLRMYLALDSEIEVVGEACTGLQAIELVRDLHGPGRSRQPLPLQLQP